MSIEKEKLFNIIRKKMPNNLSITDEVADVLDISYDAAYRRLNGKTALSFEEGLKLAKYYKISLNHLYALYAEEKISVLKYSSLSTRKGMLDFFSVVNKSVSLFSKFKSPIFYYAAKEVPFYYLPKNSLYSKFVLFAYLHIYSNKKKTVFEDFKLDSNLKYESICFKNAFRKLKGVEIWNDATINNSLYQIYYFYQINVINKEEAKLLCKELKILIKDIEKQAKKGVWSDSDYSFDMYYNKLISLNNTLFFDSEKISTLLIPYTSRSYLRIDDEETCAEIKNYFEKKLQFSKKISGNAEVERKVFFTSMYEKIDQLYNQIDLKSSISFM